MLGDKLNDPIFGQMVISHGPSSIDSALQQSLKFDETLLQSVANPQTNLTYSFSTVKNYECGESKQHKFQSMDIVKINNIENQCFQCSCKEKSEQNCFICHGNKIIGGNDNIVKFLDFILQFKLGLRPSYQHNQWSTMSAPIKPKFSLNSTTDHLKKNPQFYGSSMISSSSNCRRVKQSTIIDKCQKSRNLHQGYDCNNCNIFPIKGNRYHCTDCQNYDLCQICYKNIGHNHFMEQVRNSKYFKQINTMANFLTKSQRLKHTFNDQSLIKHFRSSIR